MVSKHEHCLRSHAKASVTMKRASPEQELSRSSLNLILWSSIWETGIEKIDNQHKELLRQMNNLFDAINYKDAENNLPGMLMFLSGYVDAHFRDEEEAMDATEYPGLASHRAVHEDMRKQVGVLIAQFQEDPAVVTAGVVNYLVEWLVNHMEGDDLFMAAHLIRCSVNEAVQCEVKT